VKKLAVLTVALIVTFVFAPAMLAADASSTDLTTEGRLVATFRGAFVDYWSAGTGAFEPGLQRVVDYWFRYHIAKALLAAALLAVLIALGVLIWRAFLRAGGPRAALLAAGGALTTGLAVLALATVMANIHGMAAPFGSLLPMLFGGPGGPTRALPSTLAQVRQALATGQHPPALQVITRDYVRFHVVMAVEGAIVVVVLVVVSVLLWRQFVRTDHSHRRARKLLASYGVFTPLLLLTLSTVVAANAMTAAHPLPGLKGFFAGGW
jgi:hypothetical protein